MFKALWSVANDAPGSFGFYGLKVLNRTNPEYVIPRINLDGDTVSVAQQDSVVLHHETYIQPGQQKKIPNVKWGLNDPIVIGYGDGRIYVFVRPYDFNYTVSPVDFEGDGIVDEVYVEYGAQNNRFLHPKMTREILGGEYAWNEVLDFIYYGFSNLARGGSGVPYILPPDKKYRRIVENFPPLERLEDYLGGVSTSGINERLLARIKEQANQNTEKQLGLLRRVYEATRKHPEAFVITPKADKYFRERLGF